MKLVRYGNPGKEKPGLIDLEGRLRDLSGVLPDLGPAQLGGVMMARLRRQNLEKLPLVRGKPRFGCPVANVGKFIAARPRPTGKWSWASSSASAPVTSPKKTRRLM